MTRIPRLSHPALMVAALLAGVALVYAPGLNGGFVFDDYANIVNNTKLQVGFDSGSFAWLAAAFSSPSADLQRPLAMLSFAINHALTGLDPYWMKLTNIGIHLANTLLVFLLALALLRAAGYGSTTATKRVALWIAAAWALNPINLMAVLFVVQRMESLCHTFVFAGLLMYLAGRKGLCNGDGGWPILLAGIVGGTGLGALVKESALLLPAYALAIEWALLGFRTRSHARDPKFAWLYGAILVLPAIAGMALMLPGLLSGAAYSGRDFTMGERLLTESRVVIDYLRWTLIPDLGQLSLYHDDYSVSHGMLEPPATLISLLGLGLLATTAAWLRQRRPLMALGIAWFFIAQLMTATVIPLELVYEHRNYFASLGICIVVGDALLLASRQMTLRRAGMATALLLLVAYSGTTILRAREWSDPLRFAVTEAAKHPHSPRATYSLARTLVILTDYDRTSAGLAPAFRALERAMAVPHATPLPEAAAIVLASRTGRPVEPRWWYQMQDKLQSTAIGPQQISAMATLVDCQLERACQLPRQALLDTFAIAIQNSRHPELFNIYGNYALNALNDPALALELWLEAAELAPTVAQYQVSIAKLLIASGQPALAKPYIASLRNMGRLGQNEAVARELESMSLSKPK